MAALREILDSGDAVRLAELLAEEPVSRRPGWSACAATRRGLPPLGYVAMQRYDTVRREWRDVTGTGEMARALLAAGAPEDGDPGEQETPLITAASYGDSAVALVLVGAGADLEARASDDAGRHPLQAAASNGRPASVRRLLAHGADPSLRDEQGRTPLELCRSGTTPGHREVETILARGRPRRLIRGYRAGDGYRVPSGAV